MTKSQECARLDIVHLNDVAAANLAALTVDLPGIAETEPGPRLLRRSYRFTQERLIAHIVGFSNPDIVATAQRESFAPLIWKAASIVSIDLQPDLSPGGPGRTLDHIQAAVG